MKKSQTKEKRLTKTNPNGVNQYTEPDPRQMLFIAAYTDPQSPTFSNAYQSAMSVGYAEAYAAQIRSLAPDWLVDASRKLAEGNRVFKYEKHLDELADVSIRVPAMGAFGPIFQKVEKMVKVKYKNGTTKLKKRVEKVPVMVYSASLIQQKTNAAKIVLEGLAGDRYGKNKGGGPSAKFVFNFKSNKNKYAA